MLDNISFFHKQTKVENVPDTHIAKETLRFEKEEKKLNNFFKRKKINPHILYNTLIYITPFFHHRENDWEDLLKIIIRENEHRRPNYTKIQTWFHNTLHSTLNNSETKYLCRYVKMSSTSNDRESKLRESMDNIDLPPIKYDSWVNHLFTLEYDDSMDDPKVTEANSPSRNYFKEAFDSVVMTVGGLHASIKSKTGKTHPEHGTLKRQLSNSKLTFSSKPVRSRYNRTNEPSDTFDKNDSNATLTVSLDSNNESAEAIDLTRNFSRPDCKKGSFPCHSVVVN